MQKTKLKKVLSLLLCTVLIAAIALFVGCNNNTPPDETKPPVSTPTSPDEATVIGEGKTRFTFTVTDLNSNETTFTIKTDKTTVGEALLDAKLITGDQGDYGLYVKTVNGITLDYDKDGAYWAFYVDGAYASTGVDKTDINTGSVYTFKAEKA